MKLEVEVLVVDPVGIVDVQRDVDEPLPKDPGGADTLANARIVLKSTPPPGADDGS
jgi:hypothetical protein